MNDDSKQSADNGRPAESQRTPICFCCSAAATSAHAARRGFLAVFLGAFALAVPLLIGFFTFLNPLRLKEQAGRFFRIATLDALPEDGTPRKFPVIADRRDAWTLFPNEPIGSVFLRRNTAGTAEEGKPAEIMALCVICPHAGCFISYDEKKREFLCPCHTAHFDLSGKRIDPDSPSPRDMDMLEEIEIREGSEIWVRFQNFRTGSSRKVAKS